MTKNLMMVCEAKLSVEAQSGAAEPTGKIEARVTTWGAREGADGRKFNYQPEGFMDWAKSFSTEGKPLPMFLNHAADSMPVGEWHSFEFDDNGMTASGRLYMNTTAGSDLYQIMTESPSMFGGVSVGAYADEYQWVKEDGTPMMSDDDTDEGFFQITKGGLREVSVVMYPNNPNAEVQKLEYFREDGSANLKNLEKALREAGISKKDAVTSASVFKKVLELREVIQVPIENAPQLSESDVDVTEEAVILKALEMRELAKLLDKRLKG
jgi:HK97 family phage prohead protease